MNGLRKYIINLCELGKARAKSLPDYMYFGAVRREVECSH